MENNLQELKREDCIEDKVYYAEVIYKNESSNIKRIIKFRRNGYTLWDIRITKQTIEQYSSECTKPALNDGDFTWYFREATTEEIEWAERCLKANTILEGRPEPSTNTTYEIY